MTLLQEIDLLNPQQEAPEKDYSPVLKALAEVIIDKLSDVTISTINDSVKVENLDEVTAALRNELTRALKPLIGAVKNTRELKVPDSTTVSNLDTLKPYFEEMAAQIIQAFNIPAPVVNVEAPVMPDIQIPEVRIPEINIPAPVVNIPENSVNLDLSPVLRALDLNLNRLRTNSKTRPLAVRMTDGQDWIKEVQKINETLQSQGVHFQALSDTTFVKDRSGNRINPATNEGFSLGRLVPEMFDSITLTYVASGNGAGEVETATYKNNGTTVATVTLTYNASDEIETITRT